ncbi:quinol oxidase [Sulfolobus sp. A20]|uniref:thiosulfate:quinone oxidoreductase large subunit n=2 Tax=Sulfolobaceae TaxID=118883 RepID=UPI000845C689|nr:thiosulfate:quinone oxidoreductase large subunit [Sulfolobus sp. A20]TRM75004.1 DoxX family membrane protein [Sulfolobus sp. B5]TRM75918.1 DoxX family membrane protein [Sulfolobus sp. E5]TRM81816.1 DoxX family membrane protein [Sulfolobus sp. D5]TRM83809.1 DoxX family membrane protein [Sulfolobus sp. A20-N-F6]TRM84599.1 DoxX family membrane protein [Sulfolobus sp. F3]TRM89685.1 DoxX family membrane protein [Sulfolobus sp. C3]TRN00949.1 DoxX family membrane protein [Sulfolobus sp. F1]TRN0
MAKVVLNDGNSTRLEYLWPLRFAVGWMFLDGGLRKAVLKPAKLDPTSPSFVGGKLVNFLPHAGPFKQFLLMVLENHSLNVTFLTIFSYVEIIAGFLIIIGLFTRLASFGAAVMAFGMAPAYWLGSTCEDEWQIGSLLTAGAIVLMLTASGRVWGLDYFLFKKFGDRPIANLPILRWIKLW